MMVHPGIVVRTSVYCRATTGQSQGRESNAMIKWCCKSACTMGSTWLLHGFLTGSTHTCTFSSSFGCVLRRLHNATYSFNTCRLACFTRPSRVETDCTCSSINDKDSGESYNARHNEMQWDEKVCTLCLCTAQHFKEQSNLTVFMEHVRPA
jgi:hypothetical protein